MFRAFKAIFHKHEWEELRQKKFSSNIIHFCKCGICGKCETFQEGPHKVVFHI